MRRKDLKVEVLFFKNVLSNIVSQNSYLNRFKLYLKILLNKRFCFVSVPCLLKWMGVTVQSTNFILLLNDQIYWNDESHFLGQIAKILIKHLSFAFMEFLALRVLSSHLKIGFQLVPVPFEFDSQSKNSRWYSSVETHISTCISAYFAH